MATEVTETGKVAHAGGKFAHTAEPVIFFGHECLLCCIQRPVTDTETATQPLKMTQKHRQR
jgi:hypothetical protein